MALDLADHLWAALPELRVHPTAKRIRALVGGAVVVDSTRALIVWEPRRIVPAYAVPTADVRASFVESAVPAAEARPVTLGAGPPVLDPGTGFTRHTVPGRALDVTTTSTVLAGAAFAPEDPDLDGYAILDFDAFDEWREEDELLVGHARDPFTTVDTRRSSRHVVVQVAGETIADSSRSVMLFETYLPTRYYLPRDDVRMDRLRPTTTTTVCAYKGRARYWTAEVDGHVLADVAWSYEEPHNYAVAVRDLVCFFGERVDIHVDGRPIERPRTPWS